MGLDPLPFDRWFDEPPKSAGHRGGAADGAGITGQLGCRETTKGFNAGQAPMPGAAALQAGVAIPQFQVGAIEDIALNRFEIWRKIGGWGQEDHAMQHIDFHHATAAAISAEVAQAGLMRRVNSSGIAPLWRMR